MALLGFVKREIAARKIKILGRDKNVQSKYRKPAA